MSVTDLKFNKLITDTALGFLQDTSDFFATSAFPLVSSPDEYGSYPQYKLEDVLRTTMERVAPGSAFKKVSRDLEWKTIELYKHGVDVSIADEKKKRISNAMQMEANISIVDAYRYIDKLTIDKVLADSIFDNTKTGNSDFTYLDDATSGDPIGVITEYVDYVGQTTGLPADSILLTKDVHRKLRNHADIIGRIGQNVGLRTASDAALAELFGVQNVFVAKGVENTANKGNATQTASYQATNTILVYHRGVSAINAPGAAQIIYCNDPIYGGNLINMLEGRDEDAECDILRTKGYFMPVVKATCLGLKIKTVMTP